jgi:uncharacterized BrkB/YihY/UPF0761 family membrane protein
MEVYLIGIVISLILCIILHLIEWYEGIPKSLGEDLFVTLIFSISSWVAVLLLSGAVFMHLLELLQRVRIKGRKQ